MSNSAFNNIDDLINSLYAQDDTQHVLHSPFDFETHKKTFINYLEVVILPDGTIEYAVPSHQEKLIAIACERLKIDRTQLFKRCPPERHFSVADWLCELTGCVSVWNDFCVKPPQMTTEQHSSLFKLKTSCLYSGEL